MPGVQDLGVVGRGKRRITLQPQRIVPGWPGLSSLDTNTTMMSRLASVSALAFSHDNDLVIHAGKIIPSSSMPAPIAAHSDATT